VGGCLRLEDVCRRFLYPRLGSSPAGLRKGRWGGAGHLEGIGYADRSNAFVSDRTFTLNLPLFLYACAPVTVKVSVAALYVMTPVVTAPSPSRWWRRSCRRHSVFVAAGSVKLASARGWVEAAAPPARRPPVAVMLGVGNAGRVGGGGAGAVHARR